MAQRSFRNELWSAIGAVGITDNSLTTHDRCRSVYIGTSQTLDFSFDGVNWVTFQGLIAGTTLDIQVVAARITAGGAGPNANDVVFLY